MKRRLLTTILALCLAAGLLCGATVPAFAAAEAASAPTVGEQFKALWDALIGDLLVLIAEAVSDAFGILYNMALDILDMTATYFSDLFASLISSLFPTLLPISITLNFLYELALLILSYIGDIAPFF